MRIKEVNLLDVLIASPDYFYGKCVDATNKNLNSDSRV